MEKVISRKKRKSVADRIFVVCNTIFMILFVAITLYPVINTLAISFNDGTDALRGGIYLWPRKFTLKNYITVLQKDSLVTGAIISVLRTVIGTLFALVANAILAFIVSRKRFLFGKQLSLFWVITMYVNGGMIPKLDNAFAAIDAGVTEVIITKASALNDLSKGSHLV